MSDKIAHEMDESQNVPQKIMMKSTAIFSRLVFIIFIMHIGHSFWSVQFMLAFWTLI